MGVGCCGIRPRPQDGEYFKHSKVSNLKKKKKVTKVTDIKPIIPFSAWSEHLLYYSIL